MFTPDKKPAEEEWYYFDFAPALAPGEELVSSRNIRGTDFFITAEMTNASIRLTDPDVAAMVVDNPVLMNTHLIAVKVGGGIRKLRYVLHCRCPTTEDQYLEECDTIQVDDCG